MPHITPNVCLADRCIRFVLGVTCVYYGFFEHTFITNPIVARLIGAFGAVNLLAATASYCPVYALCGVSSIKQAPAKDAGEHPG